MSVLTLAFVSLSFAQSKDITGTVTEAGSGFPLPGVNIAIKGTTTGTATGIDGTYSIRANNNDILVFSFVGYLPQEITVGSQNVINVQMEEDQVLLEEVVVVGYGAQRKADVTGAVGSVKADEANIGLITSPEQLIQGRVAGVSVTANTGEPGGAVTVRIRGGTSISAGNDPLYVVDGVPIDNSPTTPGGAGDLNIDNGPRNPLTFLNPSDIESIDILKDASAAAIYGSRGANGVILITTKKGREGQVQVDYDGYVSSSAISREVDLITGDQYRQLVRDSGLGTESLGSANTNWQDAITQTAVSHSHNLAFSGGTANSRYRASLGYLNQEGIILNSGLERVTGRVNADHQAFDGKLKLGLNVTTAYTLDNNVPTQQAGGFEGGLFTNVFKMNPTFAVRNADGTYVEYPSPSIRNPVAMAEQIEDFTKTTRALGNITAEYSFIEGLSAKVNVGLDRAQASRRVFVPKASPVAQAVGGQANQTDRELSSRLLETTLNFRRTLNDAHTINLLAGYSWQDYLIEQFSAAARGFVTDAWSFNNLSGGSDFSLKPSSGRESSKVISFFGRLNYDYNGKYLLTATLRRDGSSRFGENDKWGLFPSASFAWRLSEESFLSTSDVLTDLKLRVGYGVTGSQEIGNYRSLATLTPNPDFIAIIGDQEVTGVAPNNFANPDLKWEETTTYNVGLDFSLWLGRIEGSVEYYIKNTNDLLLEIQVPQPAVVSTRLENAGEIQNKGIEFALNAVAIDKGDLSVNLGATFNANKNEVKNLAGRDEIFTGRVSGAGQSGVNGQKLIVGEPFGTFFGPVFTGIVDGKQQFEDIDGDGVVELSGDDRAIIGVAQPDFTYGLTANVNFKSWDLGVFLRGVQGVDIFNNSALEYTVKNNVNTNINLLAPALTDGTDLTETPVYSSRWIQNGSFLRMENVTLGYTFNNVSAFSQVVGVVRRARVYVSAQNLFVITPYDGFDPEVNTNAGNNLGAPGGLTSALAVPSLGYDYVSYPKPRTITLGVSIGF